MAKATKATEIELQEEVVEVLEGMVTIIGLGVIKSHLEKDSEHEIDAETAKRLAKQGWCKIKPKSK